MTDDRKSIVDYIKSLAANGELSSTSESMLCILAAQIERGDDLIPAKPKTTIADLLALHDLDLGALAHKVGVTGEGFTTAHSLLLLGSYTRCDDDYLTMATDAGCAMDGGWMECARRLGALGAKVRAALSAPTTVTICYPDGRGWHIYATALETTRKGWLWKEHGTIIAEGLTEAECRHLSGLSAADALAWCEQREVARRG